MGISERVQIETSCAVLVDVQERLFPHMADADELQSRIIRLIQGLQILGVGITTTEQYPKGLGHTLPEIRSAIDSPPEGAPQQPGPADPVEKNCFSCADSELFLNRLTEINRRKVILAGIEAHVCVQQTALDLLQRGYEPVVVADCVSSRSRFDMDIALQRLRFAGATVTSSEAVLFELCRFAGTDTFKQISKLVK
jgi:nicotinamidase-related amidase